MILVAKTSDQRDKGNTLSHVCMYVCIFIKLRIPAKSGPVILVILCYSH